MAEWDWLLASEYGRDKMLRTQVEDLAAASASARTSTARLSSQLASLQGSLDTRLSALSAAFDAYVELGDVREQLGAYGPEAAVRRQVMAAVEALAAGRTAEPVPLQAKRYWLPYATNAVIALVAGAGDPAAEEQARALSRDADLFVVVLLGALDRGALVANRLPDLLVSDGILAPAQLVLWRALLAGVFPEPEAGGTSLLEAVGEGWRSTLAGGEGSEWRAWVDQHVGGEDSVDLLQWIEDLLHGRILLPLASQPSAATAPLQPREELQGVALEMVAAGSDPERDLLLRARELRRRIEHPTGSAAEVPAEVEVRSLVRDAFASETDPGRRAVLLEWLRPGLARALAAIEAAPDPSPGHVRRSLPRGVIIVGPSGPDAAQLETVRQRVGEAYPRATSRPLVPAIVAALVGVVALVGLAAGWSGALVILLLLAAAGTAVAAVLVAQGRRAAQRAVEADQLRIDQVVAEATAEAVTLETAYQERQAARQRLTAALHTELGSPEPVLKAT